jgi:hypothetical protein
MAPQRDTASLQQRRRRLESEKRQVHKGVPYPQGKIKIL